jgi:SWIM zinc finger
MATVPHAVPSRTAHAIATLYGHEDETLIAWQRFCAQAAEALRPQPDPERLSKALALAQGGHVEVEDDGFAVVTSGTKLYHVQADGSCDCPDYQNRRTSCKHVLAVLIHARAQELVASSPSPASPAAASSTPAPAPTPTKPMRQAKPRHSAAWDVHEAPVSSCFKIRVGAFEWTHTMRATDDAELHTRVQAFVPTFREVVAALDALQAARDAVKAAPAVPHQPPAAPAAAPQADLQALVQQAVQQALAAQANGQPPSTGAAPSGAPPDDQQTGCCSLHQAEMTEHTDPASGDTWYSHYCDETQRYCKGSRPTRRNGRR